MHTALRIWGTALCIYTLCITRFLPEFWGFFVGILLAIAWGAPALLLFWLALRYALVCIKRPALAYAAIATVGMLLCFVATLGATWHVTEGHEFFQTYLDEFYFPGAAMFGTAVSLVLARKSLLRHHANQHARGFEIGNTDVDTAV